MLRAIMLNVVMLNVVMLNVIILNVVMSNVMAPYLRRKNFERLFPGSFSDLSNIYR
jgi:hypothetical protein